ncbi:hypothetical protein Agub_g6397 [Astrephomene gubernaculifera]|uniref:Protein kinase domain-containing protein n=1 Tax=Astrephomene gubernaculifera TaxID=47775 RepID=A0AAD3HL27_9CHLO|nr:hypothetical protein Agub_g6397 [Astrephomene gubernaculifera]
MESHFYRFERHIGDGAYGAVHACVGPSGELVAVKQCKHTDNPEITRMMHREIRVLRSLPPHPCIVPLLDAFRSRSSGRIHLVFKLMERNLSQDLEDAAPGRLQSELIKLIAWQVVLALAHCHQHKVMHRDVKPGNVLLSGGGNTCVAKLCDFGFARLMGSTGQEPLSSYVVTRWYRSPEVIVGDDYGAPSDIWSLGCTLAELATGDPLFPGRSSLDQLARIIRCQGQLPNRQAACVLSDRRLAILGSTTLPRTRTLAERLPDVEPGLLDIISACLALDPAQRPTANCILQLPYFHGIPRLLQAAPASSGLQQMLVHYRRAVQQWTRQQQQQQQPIGQNGTLPAQHQSRGAVAIQMQALDDNVLGTKCKGAGPSATTDATTEAPGRKHAVGVAGQITRALRGFSSSLRGSMGMMHATPAKPAAASASASPAATTKGNRRNTSAASMDGSAHFGTNRVVPVGGGPRVNASCNGIGSRGGNNGGALADSSGSGHDRGARQAQTCNGNVATELLSSAAGNQQDRCAPMHPAAAAATGLPSAAPTHVGGQEEVQRLETQAGQRCEAQQGQEQMIIKQQSDTDIVTSATIRDLAQQCLQMEHGQEQQDHTGCQQEYAGPVLAEDEAVGAAGTACKAVRPAASSAYGADVSSYRSGGKEVVTGGREAVDEQTAFPAPAEAEAEAASDSGIEEVAVQEQAGEQQQEQRDAAAVDSAAGGGGCPSGADTGVQTDGGNTPPPAVSPPQVPSPHLQPETRGAAGQTAARAAAASQPLTGQQRLKSMVLSTGGAGDMSTVSGWSSNLSASAPMPLSQPASEIQKAVATSSDALPANAVAGIASAAASAAPAAAASAAASTGQAARPPAPMLLLPVSLSVSLRSSRSCVDLNIASSARMRSSLSSSLCSGRLGGYGELATTGSARTVGGSVMPHHPNPLNNTDPQRRRYTIGLGEANPPTQQQQQQEVHAKKCYSVPRKSHNGGSSHQHRHRTAFGRTSETYTSTADRFYYGSASSKELASIHKAYGSTGGGGNNRSSMRDKRTSWRLATSSLEFSSFAKCALGSSTTCPTDFDVSCAASPAGWPTAFSGRREHVPASFAHMQKLPHVRDESGEPMSLSQLLGSDSVSCYSASASRHGSGWQLGTGANVVLSDTADFSPTSTNYGTAGTAAAAAAAATVAAVAAQDYSRRRSSCLGSGPTEPAHIVISHAHARALEACNGDSGTASACACGSASGPPSTSASSSMAVLSTSPPATGAAATGAAAAVPAAAWPATSVGMASSGHVGNYCRLSSRSTWSRLGTGTSRLAAVSMLDESSRQASTLAEAAMAAVQSSSSSSLSPIQSHERQNNNEGDTSALTTAGEAFIGSLAAAAATSIAAQALHAGPRGVVQATPAAAAGPVVTDMLLKQESHQQEGRAPEAAPVRGSISEMRQPSRLRHGSQQPAIALVPGGGEQNGVMDVAAVSGMMRGFAVARQDGKGGTSEDRNGGGRGGLKRRGKRQEHGVRKGLQKIGEAFSALVACVSDARDWDEYEQDEE